MPTGYVLGDMATKAAYFSVAVAAFICVAMTLFPGLHLLSFSAKFGCCIFRSSNHSLSFTRPIFRDFIGWPCMKDAAHFRAFTKRIAITLDTALRTRERID